MREKRVEGRVSGESQVSERERTSILWSEMNSWSAAGLSRVALHEEAE